MEIFDDLWEDDLLLEFETPDGKVPDEDDEEYSMDGDEGGDDNPPAEDTSTEEPTGDEAPPADDEGDEEYSMEDDDTSGEEPADEPAPAAEEPAGDPEAPPADDEEDDESYEIPDEGEGGDDTEGAQDSSEGVPQGDPEAPPADDDDEEFSMDGGSDEGGGEESGETSGEEGESTDGETTDDTSSSEDSGINPKLQELEEVIFDNLSDAEKQLKIKELKELYIAVYNKCTSITDMMAEIRRDEATIQIIEYISNTLIDLKQYVNDYINEIFDNKTYVENLSQLQKYIMVFNAINKVLAQIKAENE